MVKQYGGKWKKFQGRDRIILGIKKQFRVSGDSNCANTISNLSLRFKIIISLGNN